mmetsp:Transcript_70764/g.202759  ORF Transcript_70764/g.202759 Transcript_70764/m.202759 type:complete len:218 (+) Transcript_70764:1945-2598(+)
MSGARFLLRGAPTGAAAPQEAPRSLQRWGPGGHPPRSARRQRVWVSTRGSSIRCSIWRRGAPRTRRCRFQALPRQTPDRCCPSAAAQRRSRAPARTAASPAACRAMREVPPPALRSYGRAPRTAPPPPARRSCCRAPRRCLLQRHNLGTRRRALAHGLPLHNTWHPVHHTVPRQFSRREPCTSARTCMHAKHPPSSGHLQLRKASPGWSTTYMLRQF